MGGATPLRTPSVTGRSATSRANSSEGRTMEHLTPTLVSWASILEDNTRAQAEQAAAMPFIHPHVALMPDAHLGLGATVGSVIPTLGAIIPAAVGVDIGCGMRALRTQYRRDELTGRLSDCGSPSSRPSRSRPVATTARSARPRPTGWKR